MMHNNNNKAAVKFIFLTLLIDVVGLGIIIPVMPQLIKHLIGTADMSKVSIYAGWLTFLYATMQFLFSPLIGSLSDQYGRRPVLLFSLLGFGLDYLFLAFSPTIWFLFIGRTIAGITGASFTTASAYIADVSDDQNRAQNFGMIGAAFGVGFIIGPMLGGLLGEINARLPFLVAACLALVNALYGYFILPESLSKENRRAFDIKRANPLGALSHLRKYPAVAGLIFSLVLIYIGAHAVQSNWSFANIEKFKWTPRMIGISLGVVGLLVGIVQGILIRFINPRLGNEKSVYVGIALYAVGLFLFAFGTSSFIDNSSSWVMFVFLIPYCLGGISGPALQALISVHVPKNEQGELQGSLTSIMSVTSIVGPLLMTGLFSYFTDPTHSIYFPGAAFLMGGFLMLFSAITAYKVLKNDPIVKAHEPKG
jgi:DHA1 family tetracycline resistance protein-like MFS transporter